MVILFFISEIFIISKFYFFNFYNSMRIQTITPNLLTFRAINLNTQEKEKSDKLISELHAKKNKDKIKCGLLDIFDRHIQNEAAKKAKGIYFEKDVLQNMYLKFFEAIENIKDLTTENLIKILNTTSPDENELKEQYRFKTLSLNKKVQQDNKLTLEDKITEENLPVYLSTYTEKERKNQHYKIQKLAHNTNLTSREKKLLDEKSSGKTFEQIAEKHGQCKTLTVRLIHNAIAKIQNSNGMLPETFNRFIDAFILKYKLNISKEHLKDIVLNNTYLLSYPQAKLFQNIDNTAELLEIEAKSYAKSALKKPSLFYQKSKTIKENIRRTSALLEIEPQNLIRAALKQPTLFYQKPETIEKNIQETAKLIDIEPKNYVKAVLKQPALFSQKTKTIEENINKTSELLGLDPKHFIQIALKKPQLFYQKPETIIKNVQETAKLLEIEPQNLIKAILKQPQLFCQKPETIVKNIYGTAELFKIDPKYFIQVALKRPQLFYQKPETLKQNIAKTASLLKIEPENFISTALKYSQLFYRKPESIIKKVKIIQYYNLIQNKDSNKISISIQSDNYLYEKILNYLVKKEDGLKSAIKRSEFIDYLKQSSKLYSFEIPNNKLADELIKFAKELSEKYIGKQIFSFKIKL